LTHTVSVWYHRIKRGTLSDSLFITVRRRDHVDAKCVRCSAGTYGEVDHEMMRCANCQHLLTRWLTKAEFLMHQAIATLQESEDE
jgi:phage FluMu protein Com